MTAPFTRTERDAIVRRLREIDRALYPENEADTPKGRAAKLLEEQYYQLLAEYGDRLPRMVMGASPFTGELLKCSFDPHDLSGPWWFSERTFVIDEPTPPAGFHVLLGALSLHGRAPNETTDRVIPGPEVPFVIPRLLKFPGMIAVISQLNLEAGDTAYPISYWSPAELQPQQLHQPWLRQELWFDGSWTIANDEWDFDLDQWIEKGSVMWIEPGDAKYRVLGKEAGTLCPYVGLEGDQQPQELGGGERELMDLPDGTILDPFEEA